jgi:hypothetical protein
LRRPPRLAGDEQRAGDPDQLLDDRLQRVGGLPDLEVGDDDAQQRAHRRGDGGLGGAHSAGDHHQHPAGEAGLGGEHEREEQRRLDERAGGDHPGPSEAVDEAALGGPDHGAGERLAAGGQAGERVGMGARADEQQDRER